MKYFLTLILSVFSVFIITACGSSSGGGDDTAAPQTVTFTTSIDMDGIATGASLFGLNSFAAPSAAQNVEVRLYLSDGRSILMTKTSGSGFEYTAEIEYPAGTAIYIEALVDNIVLKNFFDSVTVQDGSVSLGGTTPLTTLLVDILEEIGSVGIKEAFTASSFAGLDVNVTEARTDVVDDATKYTTLKSTYKTQLTWDNTANDISAELVQAVKTYAEQEGFDFGTGGELTEQQEAKAFADEFMRRMILKGDFASLVYADGFLDGGQTAEEFIANVTADVARSDFNIVLNDNRVEKVSDGLYKFFQKNRLEILKNGVAVGEDATDDQAEQKFTGYIKKINGSWYFIGNQDRVWFDVSFGENFLWFGVEEHNAYPVTSVSVSSSSLQSSVAFAKDGSRWTADIPSYRSYDGKTFTVTVTYSDDRTSSQTYVIPAWVNRTISINSAVKNGDGTVTVNYSIPSDGNTRGADIGVNNFEQKQILWGNNKTVILPADVFVSGQNAIYLDYNDIYKRYYSTSYQMTY